MHALIARSPAIRGPGPVEHHDLVPGLVTVGTLLLAMVIALAFPAMGMWSLLLLVAALLVIRVLSRGRAAT